MKTFLFRLCAILLAMVQAFPAQAAATGFSPVSAAPFETFAPVVIRGLKISPEDPFRLDFMMDTGTGQTVSGMEPSDTRQLSVSLNDESLKLIRYFLAALTLPESDLWVNLSPSEPDRILPDALSQTDLGRDLLAQDYALKRLTASLLDPETETGKKFWERVYEKSYEQNIPSPLWGGIGRGNSSTEDPHPASPIKGEERSADDLLQSLNKIWIVPDVARVRVRENGAYVESARLKVMMEGDDPAQEKDVIARSASDEAGHDKMNSDEIASQEALAMTEQTRQTIRSMILPLIEREVNNGEAFAPLRQIYHSLILAIWFKRHVRRAVWSQGYVGQSKLSGLETDDLQHKQRTYQLYLDAFARGAQGAIHEEYDPSAQQVVVRQHFTGGIPLEEIASAYREEPMTDASPVLNGPAVGVSVRAEPAMMASPARLIIQLLKAIARKKNRFTVQSQQEPEIQAYIEHVYKMFHRPTQKTLSGGGNIFRAITTTPSPVFEQINRVLADGDISPGQMFIFTAEDKDVLEFLRQSVNGQSIPTFSLHHSRANQDEWAIVKGAPDGEALIRFSLEESILFDWHFYVRPPRTVPAPVSEYDADLWTDILDDPARPYVLLDHLTYKDIVTDMRFDALMPSQMFVVTPQGLFGVETEALQKIKSSSGMFTKGDLLAPLRSADQFLLHLTQQKNLSRRVIQLLERKLISFEKIGWGTLTPEVFRDYILRTGGDERINERRRAKLWKMKIRRELLSRKEKTVIVFDDPDSKAAFDQWEDKVAFLSISDLVRFIVKDAVTGQMLSSPTPVSRTKKQSGLWKSYQAGSIQLKGLWFSARSEKAPVVVFVPPLGSASTQFRKLAEFYQSVDDVNVLLLDPCGYGRSQGRFRKMGVGDHKDLEKVLEQIREEFPDSSVILHGMSMGAIIAAKLVSERPDMVDRLIIQSMPPNFHASFVRWMTVNLQTKWGDALSRAYPELSKEKIRSLCLRMARQIDQLIFKKKLREFHADPDVYADGDVFHRTMSDLSKIPASLPLLILAEKHDSLVSETERAAFRTRFPQVVWVNGEHNTAHTTVVGMDAISQFLGGENRAMLSVEEEGVIDFWRTHVPDRGAFKAQEFSIFLKAISEESAGAISMNRALEILCRKDTYLNPAQSKNFWKAVDSWRNPTSVATSFVLNYVDRVYQKLSPELQSDVLRVMSRWSENSDTLVARPSRQRWERFNDPERGPWIHLVRIRNRFYALVTAATQTLISDPQTLARATGIDEMILRGWIPVKSFATRKSLMERMGEKLPLSEDLDLRNALDEFLKAVPEQSLLDQDLWLSAEEIAGEYFIQARNVGPVLKTFLLEMVEQEKKSVSGQSDPEVAEALAEHKVLTGMVTPGWRSFRQGTYAVYVQKDQAAAFARRFSLKPRQTDAKISLRQLRMKYCEPGKIEERVRQHVNRLQQRRFEDNMRGNNVESAAQAMRDAKAYADNLISEQQYENKREFSVDPSVIEDMERRGYLFPKDVTTPEDVVNFLAGNRTEILESWKEMVVRRAELYQVMRETTQGRITSPADVARLLKIDNDERLVISGWMGAKGESVEEYVDGLMKRLSRKLKPFGYWATTSMQEDRVRGALVGMILSVPAPYPSSSGWNAMETLVRKYARGQDIPPQVFQQLTRAQQDLWAHVSQGLLAVDESASQALAEAEESLFRQSVGVRLNPQTHAQFLYISPDYERDLGQKLGWSLDRRGAKRPSDSAMMAGGRSLLVSVDDPARIDFWKFKTGRRGKITRDHYGRGATAQEMFEDSQKKYSEIRDVILGVMREHNLSSIADRIDGRWRRDLSSDFDLFVFMEAVVETENNYFLGDAQHIAVDVWRYLSLGLESYGVEYLLILELLKENVNAQNIQRIVHDLDEKLAQNNPGRESFPDVLQGYLNKKLYVVSNQEGQTTVDLLKSASSMMVDGHLTEWIKYLFGFMEKSQLETLVDAGVYQRLPYMITPAPGLTQAKEMVGLLFAHASTDQLGLLSSELERRLAKAVANPAFWVQLSSYSVTWPEDYGVGLNYLIEIIDHLRTTGGVNGTAGHLLEPRGLSLSDGIPDVDGLMMQLKHVLKFFFRMDASVDPTERAWWGRSRDLYLRLLVLGLSPSLDPDHVHKYYRQHPWGYRAQMLEGLVDEGYAQDIRKLWEEILSMNLAFVHDESAEEEMLPWILQEFVPLEAYRRMGAEKRPNRSGHDPLSRWSSPESSSNEARQQFARDLQDIQNYEAALSSIRKSDPAVMAERSSGEEFIQLMEQNQARLLTVETAEMIRDTRDGLDEGNENARHYMDNQRLLRAGFYQLLKDVASGKMDLLDMPSRIAALHKVLITGEGSSFYLPPTVFGIFSPHEWAQRYAGLLLGHFTNIQSDDRLRDIALWPYFEAILEKLKEFVRAKDPRKAVEITVDLYLLAMPGPAAESLPALRHHLFERGNNSFWMNLVNLMLKIHGFEGMSHGDLESYNMPRFNIPDVDAGNLNIFRQEFLNQLTLTNADHPENMLLIDELCQAWRSSEDRAMLKADQAASFQSAVSAPDRKGGIDFSGSSFVGENISSDSSLPSAAAFRGLTGFKPVIMSWAPLSDPSTFWR